MPELVPGQWNLAIVHEFIHDYITHESGKKSSTRYALISPVTPPTADSECKYEVIDLPTYLEMVMKDSNDHEIASLVEHWKRNTETLMTGGICDEEEIREVIPTVAKEAAVATTGRHFWMAYGIKREGFESDGT